MPEMISEELRKTLRELELLSDDEIDTSDIPEETEWGDALRGVWNPVKYRSYRYDIRALANEVLERLWQRGVHPTNMALNKLTWFIYERALTTLHALVSDARVEAWDHGPVFREIYSPAKEHGSSPIKHFLKGFSRQEKKMAPVRVQIDPEISRLIDEVLDDVGEYSAARLRELSHREAGPWDRVWNSGRRTSAGMVISPHLIFASAAARAQQNDGR
jgi:uncharacterized phage-associated protein